MSWHGGGEIVDGILDGIEAGSVTGDMSAFWSVIVDVLGNLDYGDWHNDYDKDDALSRILTLRDGQNIIDYDPEYFEEFVATHKKYLSDEDVELLEAIRRTT